MIALTRSFFNIDTDTINFEELSFEKQDKDYCVQLTKDDNIIISLGKQTNIYIYEKENLKKNIVVPKINSISQIAVRKNRIGTKTYYFVLLSRSNNIYLRIYGPSENDYFEHKIVEQASLPRDIFSLYLKNSYLYCVYNTLSSTYNIAKFSYETVRKEIDEIAEIYFELQNKIPLLIQQGLEIVMLHGINIEEGKQ
jgi:hypothetical protein